MNHKLSLSAFLIHFTQLALCEMQNGITTGYHDKRGLRTANESNPNKNFKINNEEINLHERTKNNDFRAWLAKHSKFAAIMTVFAGADIEALKLLTSQLAGCEMFNAKFSFKANRWILWGGVINSLFEDLPQFVIQILYKENTDKDYSLIPFVTLVTSTIVLLVDIVGRIYDALNGSDYRTAEMTAPLNCREVRQIPSEGSSFDNNENISFDENAEPYHRY
ncbi:2678_t:CDS:2 [Funneliformis caledonium]|uniref:2678_t:CDS:1 n=1 Tax=Funneliformis caledonium TaxID=1117310 RepID=A0A9N8Z5D7_9GLOM|nr:2678_t:CDS:2 [Funneliformis caledonium]